MDDDPGAKENQEIYSCCTLVGRRIPLHMDPPSILLVCWLHTGSAPAPAPPSVLIKIHQHKDKANGQRYFTLNIILRPVSARRLRYLDHRRRRCWRRSQHSILGTGGDVFSFLPSLMSHRFSFISPELTTPARWTVTTACATTTASSARGRCWMMMMRRGLQVRESTAIGRPPSTPRYFYGDTK